MFDRKKKDFFAVSDHEKFINWKAVDILRRFTTRFGNIKPRKYTWLSVKHQKNLRKAIIRAREIWLIPYTK